MIRRFSSRFFHLENPPQPLEAGGDWKQPGFYGVLRLER